MVDLKHITGFTEAELVAFLEEVGEPAYRGRQIFAAIQRQRRRSFDEMTDIPRRLGERLSDCAAISSLTVESRYVSEDGTRRYLLKTRDNLPVETVFIPEERRDTICFSSQSGCPLQCDFCLTARLGLLRTLTAGEIVEQIVIALNDAYGEGTPPPKGTNLVAMGAGEPFLAFEPLMKAIRVMADPKGLHIVPRRVTVSTAGIVPRIRDLAKIPDRPHLAVSLAAPDDELRNRLMPINRRWPLEELLAACREFQASLRPGERFTFEYVMLEGVNDSDDQARRLVKLLNRNRLQRVKVNLIPHNPAEPLPYRPSTPERIARFQQILVAGGINVYVRRPRGRDIYAACGQLAAVSSEAIGADLTPVRIAARDRRAARQITKGDQAAPAIPITDISRPVRP